ncbi:hypothetical protein AKJ09_06985 [Labilithrix luteola]|uniref:Uncharacterized protein n=1 Tax=Labilithrix luteola TaxID=1391654 RepID=A0A0K1Q3W0_9BACT|nr:hypothetical protein AKJ09_06985 [Labilithrix luteola]
MAFDQGSTQTATATADEVGSPLARQRVERDYFRQQTCDDDTKASFARHAVALVSPPARITSGTRR